MTNEQVALWAGWTVETRPLRTIWTSPDGFRWPHCPDFTQEGWHWQLVYREIERRGLCMKYRYHLTLAVSDRARALWRELPEESLDCSIEYALATATPAERMAALGKVMEEEKSNG